MTISWTDIPSSGVGGWSHPSLPSSNPSLSHSSGLGGSCSSSLSHSPPSKTSGKRFVRRAKRWAELQQRRAVSSSSSTDSPSFIPPLMHPEPLMGVVTYPPSTIPSHTSQSSQVNHPSLTNSRSLPYSYSSSHSSRSCGRTYDLGEAEIIKVTEGYNEYGYKTVVSVRKEPATMTVYSSSRSSRVRSTENIGMERLEMEMHNSSLGSNGSSPASSTPNSLNCSIDDEVNHYGHRLMTQVEGEPRPYYYNTYEQDPNRKLY